MSGVLIRILAETRGLLRLGRLAGDQSGTAIVEFAVLLPVLLTLFIGSYETSNLLLAYMKLEAAAETAADLVGQTPVNTILVDSGSSNGWDFSNITSAVQQVMTPFPTTSLQVSYASITYSTGSAVIDWHKETTGATAITVGALPGGATATTMGTAATGSNDSIVAVKVVYSYTSPLSSYFNSDYVLTEWAYNRPRYVSCVPYAGANSGVCP